MLTDEGHVFFDFQPKHTSLAVWQMFKGFSGYVQADAYAIYDALFKGIPRPLVDAFFTWARAEHDKRPERGLVATALGYSIRHEKALRRFLDDGRLRMDNNSAERELKVIAVGRRAWLFYGSDDHAGAAGNTLSLIASCKLHRLDPELYLTEIIRILPYWPRTRYLELAPKYWAATRARLSPDELKLPLGRITVPPPPSKEQTSSN